MLLSSYLILISWMSWRQIHLSALIFLLGCATGRLLPCLSKSVCNFVLVREASVVLIDYNLKPVFLFIIENQHFITEVTLWGYSIWSLDMPMGSFYFTMLHPYRRLLYDYLYGNHMSTLHTHQLALVPLVHWGDSSWDLSKA